MVFDLQNFLFFLKKLFLFLFLGKFVFINFLTLLILIKSYSSSLYYFISENSWLCWLAIVSFCMKIFLCFFINGKTFYSPSSSYSEAIFSSSFRAFSSGKLIFLFFLSLENSLLYSSFPFSSINILKNFSLFSL